MSPEPGYPVDPFPDGAFDDLRDRIHAEHARQLDQRPRPEPPLFQEGFEPRGLIAPAIAAGILTIAAVLAIVGDELEQWSHRRACRKLARRLVDHMVDGPHG